MTRLAASTYPTTEAPGTWGEPDDQLTHQIAHIAAGGISTRSSFGRRTMTRNTTIMTRPMADVAVAPIRHALIATDRVADHGRSSESRSAGNPRATDPRKLDG